VTRKNITEIIEGALVSQQVRPAGWSVQRYVYECLRMNFPDLELPP